MTRELERTRAFVTVVERRWRRETGDDVRVRKREGMYRVTFHVIERRARLGRRVTRSTTRLPLPTRARNVSDRALDRTGYFVHGVQ